MIIMLPVIFYQWVNYFAKCESLMVHPSILWLSSKYFQVAQGQITSCRTTVFMLVSLWFWYKITEPYCLTKVTPVELHLTIIFLIDSNQKTLLQVQHPDLTLKNTLFTMFLDQSINPMTNLSTMPKIFHYLINITINLSRINFYVIKYQKH